MSMDSSQLEGVTLLYNYKIDKVLSSEGAFATIFSLSKDGKPCDLVAKVSKHIEMSEKELDILLML